MLHHLILTFYDTLFESLGLHTRTHTRNQFERKLKLTFDHTVSSKEIPQSKKYTYNSSYRVDRCFDGGWAYLIDNFVSTNNHLGIYLLMLLSGDIELNPGPFLNNKKLILMTQNCRGLNNFLKIKQIINNKNRIVKRDLFILALQETYLIDETTLGGCGKYVFTKADSTHSTGCITLFPDTVNIIETRDIDDKGHGHLTVIEGLGDKLMIVGNIYAPVRSLVAQQKSFYETLETLIDELETKYILYEPNLCIIFKGRAE